MRRGMRGVVPFTGAASHFRTVAMLVTSKTFPNTTSGRDRQTREVLVNETDADDDCILGFRVVFTKCLPCLPSSQSDFH